MRATLTFEAADVRIGEVPDAQIEQPTDAVIRMMRPCICSSSLWPYHDLAPTPGGRSMGHEAIGIVKEVGTEVARIRPGQLVIMPFAFSDGNCQSCDKGLHTACERGGFFGNGGRIGGAQAEALRIPQARRLSDVMGTGHHAAVAQRSVPEAAPRSYATAPQAFACDRCAGGRPPAAVRAYIDDAAPRP